MDINFKNVRFKNFMSYGNEFTNFNFSKGIDLIIGKNGKGKSTFNDAIFYGLFGKSFRKIKSGSLINRYTKKKMVVEVYFSVGSSHYKVIRGQKPNIFEIYKVEDQEYVLIPQRANVKDYQKYLEENILNLNETIFRQLIILGANLPSSKPFMDLNHQEKESLFQAITDTSIFGILKINIKNKINDKKHELKDLNYKKDLIQASLNSEQIMIEQMEKQNQDFKIHHEENINQTKNNIIDSKNNIIKYEEAIDKLKILKQKYDKISVDFNNNNQILEEMIKENHNIISKKMDENMIKYQDLLSKCVMDEEDINHIQELELKINKSKEENQNLSTLKRDLDYKLKTIEGAEQNSIQCESCNHTNYLVPIKKETILNKNNYLIEIKKIKEQITQQTDITKNLEKELYTFKNTIDDNIKVNKSLIYKEKEVMNDKLKSLEEELQKKTEFQKDKTEELKNELDSIKNKLIAGKRIPELLNENKTSLEYYNNKLTELNSIKMIEIDYKTLEENKKKLTKLVSDISMTDKNRENLIYLENLIGSNNLKGAVIKKQIPFLNKGINHFLELFSLLDYNFIIDSDFKESLISRNEVSEFNQLSNGQKARISFSIMFAFLKLIEQRNGVKTNLLILDEILDSSVDDSGREELLNILKSEFSSTKDIMIISHNSDIKDKLEIFDRLIQVERDKFSNIEVIEL